MNDQETRAPSELEQSILASRELLAGGANYRAYVGPPDQYDFMGATQFRLLTSLGLRETHRLVDLGCGSLRAGRYFIQYLMPGRYVGVEPNEWLWQEAFEKEVGQDVIGLKRPRFLKSDDFRLAGISEGCADFVVAQSIYSHAGRDLLETSLEAVSRVLGPDGQFLFTMITPRDLDAGHMSRGSEYEGWSYPECLVYSEEELTRINERIGLSLQRLAWYHPRQTWFRATHDPKLRLTPEMERELGTGRTLFDRRFE